MTLDGVLALQAIGAQILDTRDPGEFAAAHLAGSINIGLGGQYATWAGTVLDREHPIVIIADPGRENESAMRLGRIGFDHVAGYLQDGLHSLESRPELTRHNGAPQRAVRRGTAVIAPSRRWPSTFARRASAIRSTSPEAWAFRSIIWRKIWESCRRTVRCWSIARAATGRPSPRACCNAADLTASAKLPAASPAWEAANLPVQTASALP